MERFDEAAHERQLAERYRRLAMFDAFDKFIDLSIEGVITRDEAITAFVEEYWPDLATTQRGREPTSLADGSGY